MLFWNISQDGGNLLTIKICQTTKVGGMQK